jgi:uncharacterized protein (TIGR03437 family)
MAPLLRCLLVPAVLTGHAAAQTTYLLETIAGSDEVGDGGPAVSALIAQVQGIAVDASGGVYLADADGHRVRRVAPNGVITTVAGTGRPGYSGDAGLALSARLNTPYGVALDRAGNLYIADLGNARVRRVARDGIISTIAGGGAQPPSQADGRPATEAALKAPRNVAVDGAGNLYFSDFAGHRVYQVTPGGVLLHLAGSGAPGFSGDNGPARSAELNAPAGLAVDPAGTLYIADSANGRIRKVWRGLISTAGDRGTPGAPSLIPAGTPTGVALDPDGSLLIADPGNGKVLRVTPMLDVTSLSQAARDIAVDSGGTIYTCSGPYVQRRPRNGLLTVIAGSGAYGYAGDGGAARKARFNQPAAIARDNAGGLYVADQANQRVRKITPDGVVYTVAGNGLAGSSGDGGPAIAARLNFPSGVAIDAAGNLYIADSGNHRVRMVAPNGLISTVAGTGEAGFNGDNGNATRARLDTPGGLAADSAGNLYIADTGNHIVRRLTRSGTLTTVAGNLARGFSGDGGAPLTASLDSPRAVAVDADGNLYIADTGNRRVRRVSAGTALGPGIIHTFPSSGADIFRHPRGLAVDREGNVLLTDALDHRVFRIEPTGRISTIAGDGWPGFSAEAEPALPARLDSPLDIAADPAGNLYLADTGNNRIRKLTPNIEIAPPPSFDSPLTIVNAASLIAGPVVPGEIVSLFGAALAGEGAVTEVLINGRAATLLFTSPTQINLLVPESIAASTVEFQINVNGITRARAVAAVAQAAPGVFTVAGGVGQAAALNEDGLLNSPSNPAPRGSIVTLFATGTGPAALPVSLRIGDYAAELLYSGPAPGFRGLTQINARIPAGFAPPGTLPVTLLAGSASSQPGVVISVN